MPHIDRYIPAPATIFNPLTDKQLDTLIDKLLDASQKATRPKVVGRYWSLGYMADELEVLTDAINEWRHRNNLLILLSDSLGAR